MECLKYHNKFPLESNVTIPSMETLLKLLMMPSKNDPDPYCIEKYRIRPQLFDTESEKLFVKRNDALISWLEARISSPTAYDVALCNWCKRHNIDYQLVNYFHNVVKYCRLICPGMPSNPDKCSKILKAMKEVDSSYITGDKFNFLSYKSELRQRSKCLTDIDKLDKSHVCLSSRFSEYKLAFSLLCKMESSRAYIELRPAVYEEYQRVSAENRKSDKKRYGGESDGRILTQCIFCYRFHLQETSGRNRLSKHCPDCEGRYEKWRTYIRLKHGLKQSDVYIYGL
jgi:hypothetical protein